MGAVDVRLCGSAKKSGGTECSMPLLNDP